MLIYAEHTYSEYHELFTSVQLAWKLVREKLQEYGENEYTYMFTKKKITYKCANSFTSIESFLYSARCYLLIEDKYLVASLEDDTPLVYLIPTADGPGACTTALIKYLVFVHNKFIQNCRKIVCQREADMAATARKETASTKKGTILTKSRGTTGKQQAGAKKSTPTKVSSESVQQRYVICFH